ncbi:MAG: nuclear transport factor 2 family protein [Anaerolineaceae bacterium]
MALQGKGFFIWNIASCESGNAAAIAATAQAAGLSHVLVKIADGPYTFGYHPTTRQDQVPAVVNELHSRGIQVWGWHYVYGDDPVGEANVAIQRVQQLGLDGYVIDAEVEYKEPGKDAAARRFMAELRSSLSSFPIALSAFRFPTYHMDFPWSEFLSSCDLNMPQVYWLKAHNAGAQLERCVREFQAISPFRPIIPTGSIFRYSDWVPSEAEVTKFLNTARGQNLSAANFYSWDECRKYLPTLWNLVSSYSWQGSNYQDIVNRYILALNTRNLDMIMGLFASNALHITSTSTIQGTDAIRQWYGALFRDSLPTATFTLVGSSGTGAERQLSWSAVSGKFKVTDGKDTIGLIDGKISYHYSFFILSR